MKLWVLVYTYRKSCDEPGFGGVFSTKEKAIEKMASENWPEEFSCPEDGFWGDTESSCFLKEVTLDE